MTSELALDSARLLLCLGPGGVGKTTISAALGFRAALSGRSTALMTVDPAPRLLDALGLDSASSSIQPVDLHGLGARRGARLNAMRLDPREVFDRLVDALCAQSGGARRDSHRSHLSQPFRRAYRASPITWRWSNCSN